MFSEFEKSAIRALAKDRGIEPAYALGLTQVESGGRATWDIGSKKLPAIRPEGHYFWRILNAKSPALAQRAVNAGLANPKAGAVKVPARFADVYKMFERMMQIDADAAIQSISIGVGQVMGSHYSKLGFDSPVAMWNYACRDLTSQVDIMLRFITNNKAIMQAMHADKFATVAKLYNGPAYKKNKYDTKLEQAVKYWRGHTTAQQPNEIDKERIRKLGYESVEDFQATLDLKPDGQIGPKTIEAITGVEQGRLKPTKNGGLAGTAGGVGTGLLAAVAQWQGKLQELMPTIEIFKGLGEYGPAIACAVIGASLVGGLAYAWYELRHEDHVAA